MAVVLELASGEGSVGDGAAGFALLAAAAVAAGRGGWAWTAGVAGAAWFAGALWAPLATLHRGPLAYAVLAYPRLTLPSMVSAVAVAVGAVASTPGAAVADPLTIVAGAAVPTAARLGGGDVGDAGLLVYELWAPDSKSLLVQAWSEHVTSGASSDEYSIDVNGRGLRRITNGKREFWFSGDSSPDGSRIAITHVPQSLDRIEIVDMAADGSDQHVVATCLDPFGCNHPNW